MYWHLGQRCADPTPDGGEQRREHRNTHGYAVASTCVLFYIHVHVHVQVLMRDEKEERKKQARSNKQGKAIQHMYTRVQRFV